MTCRLSETNVLDATYALAKRYPGGVEALAGRLPKSPAASTLYNKMRRQVDTHVLGLEEFSEIIDSCEQANVIDPFAPLHALCWRHRHVAVLVPLIGEEGADDLVTLVCDMVREQGDVAAQIQTALANDRHIDAAEFDAIEKEFSDAIGAVAALREKVRAMHQAAKARGLVK